MRSPTLWSAFTAEQRKNILFYSIGIMSYKFALECGWTNSQKKEVQSYPFYPPPDFNGAFLTMSNERFGDNRYAKIGILTGLNYAAQGFGSIIISPLIKRLPARVLLSSAVIVFAVVSAMILIVDAATGGTLKFKTTDNITHYGTWNPNGEYLSTGREDCYTSTDPAANSPLSNLYAVWSLLRHGRANS
jgi:hypothetical protein